MRFYVKSVTLMVFYKSGSVAYWSCIPQETANSIIADMSKSGLIDDYIIQEHYGMELTA